MNQSKAEQDSGCVALNSPRPAPEQALLPCPFCGAAGQLVDEKDIEDCFHAVCSNDACEMFPGVYAETTAREAARKWNTRVGAGQIDGYEIVVSEIESHWMSFVVYDILGREADGKILYNRDGYQSSPDPVESRELAQKFMVGSIKWDGCLNLTLEDEPLHFCGRGDVEEFGKILPAIYDLAAELIPSWEGD